MCGIFGILSSGTLNNSLRILSDMFKNSEYRGSDSSGYVVINNDYVEIKKNTEIMKYADVLTPFNQRTLNFTNNLVLGHNRWATHGENSARNAHPHKSGAFYVVHNGTIENYLSIKDITPDHKYVSETDTETIAALANELNIRIFNTDDSIRLKEIAHKLSQQLEGSYSFALANITIPDKIIALRNGHGCTLVLSDDVEIKNDKLHASTVIVCSDERSVLSKSRPTINHKYLLKDKEITFIYRNEENQKYSVEISSFNENINIPIINERLVHIKDLDKIVMDKQGYDHFMIKEINDQGQLVENILKKYFRGGEFTFKNTNGHISNEEISRNIENSNSLTLIACGTSYHACKAVQLTLQKLINKPLHVQIATNFSDQYLDKSELIDKQSLFVFVSQSGDTEDVYKILRDCKNNNIKTLSFTNVDTSLIASNSDYNVDLCCGAEYAVASTKAYTAQIINMVMFGCSVTKDFNLRNKIMGELTNNFTQKIHHAMNVDISEITNRINSNNALHLFSRGFQLPTVEEAALKIKEITYIHAQGMESGELKHGTLALIDKYASILMVIVNDAYLKKNLIAYQQIVARQGRVMLVCDKETLENIKNIHKNNLDDIDYILVEDTIEELSCLLTIIPLQRISYEITLQRRLNADMPRNLAKCVTVS